MSSGDFLDIRFSQKGGRQHNRRRAITITNNPEPYQWVNIIENSNNLDSNDTSNSNSFTQP